MIKTALILFVETLANAIFIFLLLILAGEYALSGRKS